MGKRIMPFSEFIIKFNKKSQGSYTYLDGYTRMSNKIKVQCNICGHIFEPIASYFVNTNSGCKKCDLIKRAEKINNLEKQNKKVQAKRGKDYSLIEYNGYNEEATFLHHICGNEYKTRYSFFIEKNFNCPCARTRKHTKYTIDELKKTFHIKDVDILDITYPGPKIKIKCLKCNTIKEIGLETYKHYKFTCCKKIASLKKKELQKTKAKKYFKQLEEQKEYKKKKEGYIKQLKNETKYYKYYTEFKTIHGNDIEIKEKKYKVEEKFLVKCNICNHKWKTNFKKLREGKGCSLCKSSKGEKAINKYLLDNNYSFKREYRFENTEISLLRFDFAVDLNNKLYLIEFDGKQHFNIESQFGDNNKEEKFNKIVANDKKKDKYCKDNNIPLLRIPYWEFDNIEKLLSKFLTLEE